MYKNNYFNQIEQHGCIKNQLHKKKGISFAKPGKYSLLEQTREWSSFTRLCDGVQVWRSDDTSKHNHVIKI